MKTYKKEKAKLSAALIFHFVSNFLFHLGAAEKKTHKKEVFKTEKSTEIIL